MTGGTYTLLIELDSSARIDVGALGNRRFEPGWYAYTGSAFGPGGFARIDRHHRIARDEHDVRHWHVDHLLGHDATTIDDVIRTSDRDIECAVATSLPDAGIPGFGASDCDCRSHLAYAGSKATLVSAVDRAHDATRTERSSGTDGDASERL